ncbi:polysaccharide biosynthesis/export family protein [Xaviernesmea oryzae]|uniref:polysaccharide biosynthesis/export family protein n=1 Tax=Xaviernesmea oryzae TaxID=464029 RepID=UPI00147B6071|nr:polysaccharide biosynthesis/export family protein [Xaviernesmea oryzae]
MLIPVTATTLSLMTQIDPERLSTTFGSGQKQSVSLIGVGDIVMVSIWEASDNGLFSAGTGAKSGGTQIPEQPVGEDGMISVPYAGQVRAAGRTPQQVKTDIEKALTRMAVEPQVLVHVVKNVSNTVTVTGEVAQSGLISLSPRATRILDVIALAGGPRSESQALAVQITRGTRSQTVPLERLISDPRENIYVQPNDIVALIRQPRSFTVFGAATANSSIQFDEPELYLNQALAKVGGLSDERADAKGVFIYRTEPASVVARMAPGRTYPGAGNLVNVIYQIDLKDPNGFFLMKSFRVQNRDLVYIANSSLAEIRKFSTLVSMTAAPVAQAATIGNTVTTFAGK